MPWMRRQAGAERSLVTLIVVLTVLLVIIPLARLGQTVADEASGRLGRIITAPGMGTAVLNTVLLAVAVTVIAVPAGTVLALGLRRPDVPARTFWRVAVLLPLVVPQFVLGYSWTQAYGRAGFTNALFGLQWAQVLGAPGVVVVLAVDTIPVSYLLAAVGLATRAEPDLERAARASGASAATTLRTVTLPLLRPALAAAAVLSFVLTLESFAVPQVLGTPAGFSTVTTRIYADLSVGGDPFSFVEAITLALLLVVMAAVVVAPADAVVGPRLRTARLAGGAGAPPVSAGGLGRWGVAAGVGTYLLVAVAVPLVALGAAAVTRAVGLPPTPRNWTLANLRAVLNQTTRNALAHSFELAVVTATVLVVLGGCVAALGRRRAGRAVSTLITLTLVLPGSTLAVAMLIAYGRWLGNTLTLILLAYLAKLWAIAHRPISGALDRLPPDELRASRASGATLLTAIRTVVLRPLTPALTGAWLMCFVTALHEVTMSSLLYGPGNETLAVVVLDSQQLGQIGQTAALSVVLTVVVIVPPLTLWAVLRGVRRSRRSQVRLGQRVCGPSHAR